MWFETLFGFDACEVLGRQHRHAPLLGGLPTLGLWGSNVRLLAAVVGLKHAS